jgi:hypothetical protein
MPDIKYDIDLTLGQSSAESCWYAAYCMLFTWKGIPTSSIRDRIEKAGLDYKDYWTNGLPDDDYPKTRLALGLTGFRRGYFSSLADDLEYFSKTLKDYGPFWCAFHRSSGDHAVIVNGIDIKLTQILVANPWGDGGQAEQQYYTPTSFKSRLGSKDVASAAQMFR